MKNKNLLATIVGFLILGLSTNCVMAANYYNGGGRVLGSNANVKGAKAYVECDPVYRYDDVSCWVLVGEEGTTYGGNYYQVGWCRDNAKPTTNWHFTEYRDDTSSTTSFTTYHSTASTGTYAYRVEKVGNVWYSYINDVQMHSISGLGWNGEHIAFCGETHHTSDQSPGSNYDPITMSSIKYKNSSGTWTNGLLDVNFKSLSTQKNNMSTSGSNTFEQWDSRY